MENQEEKETSIEYFYERVLESISESISYSSDEYYAITDALNEAKKIYDIEIKKAYEKGYKNCAFIHSNLHK